MVGKKIRFRNELGVKVTMSYAEALGLLGRDVLAASLLGDWVAHEYALTTWVKRGVSPQDAMDFVSGFCGGAQTEPLVAKTHCPAQLPPEHDVHTVTIPVLKPVKQREYKKYDKDLRVRSVKARFTDETQTVPPPSRAGGLSYH